MTANVNSSLRSSAGSGVRWTAVSSLITTALQVLQLAVLARLLKPDDFGLAAIALFVTSFGQVFTDLGVSAAIIHRQDSTREQLSSLYWLNIIIGMLLFIVTLLGTPVSAAVFSEPRLNSIVPWAAVVFIVVPWGQQFQVLLEKELRFNLVAQFEVLAAIAGAAAAIIAAYLEAGVYAIVAGQIVNSGARSAMLCLHGFRGRRPLLRFRTEDFRGYLSFGIYQMADRALSYLSSRVDQIALGIFAGPQILGLYNFATNLVIAPVYRLNPVLTRVAFPVFALVQEDIPRLRRGYFTLLRLISFTTSPLLFGIAAVCPSLVPTVFGSQWRGAVSAAQILVFAGIAKSLMNPIGALLLAKGRADWHFFWNVVVFVLQVPIVGAAAYFGDLRLVAFAVFALEVAQLVPFIFIVGRTLDCRPRDFTPLSRPLLVAAIMAGAVAFLGHQAHGISPVPFLVLQIAFGALIFTVLSLLLLTNDVRELVSLIPVPSVGRKILAK